jgi:hypothetical protein
LILTSSACVLDEKSNEPMREFAIIMSIKSNRHKERAFLLHKTENWALLEIPEINITKLCPLNPEPKHVLRLNLKPNLKGSSVLSVPHEEIIGSRCYLSGFNTTELRKYLLFVTLKNSIFSQAIFDRDENSAFRRRPETSL